MAEVDRVHVAGMLRAALARRRRFLVYDVVICVALALVATYVVATVSANLHRLNIRGGFDFLEGRQAGFGINETLISYDAQSSYGRAILVGLLNTLLVAASTIVLSTILGTLIGVLRLGHNRLLAQLSYAFVELFRNTPLLLQLMFWYAAILITLPNPREASPVFGFALFSNRGLFLPWVTSSEGFAWLYIGTGVGLCSAVVARMLAKRRQNRTGLQTPVFLPSLLIILAAVVMAKFAASATLAIDWPRQAGFRIAGGLSLSPELATLLIGLTLYTSALIAEIVRSGIVSVDKGQIEAARSLGFHEFRILRLVTLPLAIRVIVPPTISQYLSLMKNSSLAVAIGYPDLASITNTVINQTGQAVEGVAILMGTYLSLSLLISAVLNAFNKRMALVRR